MTQIRNVNMAYAEAKFKMYARLESYRQTYDQYKGTVVKLDNGCWATLIMTQWGAIVEEYVFDKDGVELVEHDLQIPQVDSTEVDLLCTGQLRTHAKKWLWLLMRLDLNCMATCVTAQWKDEVVFATVSCVKEGGSFQLRIEGSWDWKGEKMEVPTKIANKLLLEATKKFAEEVIL